MGRSLNQDVFLECLSSVLGASKSFFAKRIDHSVEFHIGAEQHLVIEILLQSG